MAVVWVGATDAAAGVGADVGAGAGVTDGSGLSETAAAGADDATGGVSTVDVGGWLTVREPTIATMTTPTTAIAKAAIASVGRRPRRTCVREVEGGDMRGTVETAGARADGRSAGTGWVTVTAGRGVAIGIGAVSS